MSHRLKQPDQLDTFAAALAAFEIRFEVELDGRWSGLERRATEAINGAQSDREKRLVLTQFFEKAEEEISLVVHQYYPKLLQIAAKYRERIGGQTPIGWTNQIVRNQLSDFLEMNIPFDPEAAPREGSLALCTALRISTDLGWLEDAPDSLLPGWVGLESLVWEAMARVGSQPKKREPLSRDATLEWAKHREYWIHRRLQQQIDNDMHDGVIDAGIAGVSVLDRVTPIGESLSETNRATDSSQGIRNRFSKEGAVWEIQFEGETCKVGVGLLGFYYISVLLLNAGTPMKALELQAAATGLPSCDDFPEAEDSLKADVSDSGSDRHRMMGRFENRYEVIDDKAIRQNNDRLRELETMIVHAQDSHDNKSEDSFKKEKTEIEAYMKRSRNVRGRSRTFLDDTERARVRITKALNRAYLQIAKQAPKTAGFLTSQIATGSTFMYRDTKTAWKVYR